ncbi:MAG: selenide, water dikinase SelD [Planctomycetaceae bacterium]|nr:selenide, water dikinase SelD [Planctomycetaceae bacterium]
MINIEKRKLIMGRSMRLGHCVCDPKKPCPCDIFQGKNVCLCAGERLEDAKTKKVQLTKLVEKAGCASKIDQKFLKNVLRGLPSFNHPNVLVGAAAGDDAGVYKISKDTALVQTVDVFTPSVDDPYVFGQVAAANSVSDVYAMGGRPITALSIIGFPCKELKDSIMRDILRGGIDKMIEAEVPVIGGHSINDPQIKAGFAVTGLINPKKILTNANAKSGDVLILTKPLGTGIIAFASQIDKASAKSVKAISNSMATLNKKAAELMQEFDVHACTDVTGFSLMGHLGEMAGLSKVNAEILFDAIPLFPGVLEAVNADIVPGTVERNRESSGHRIVTGKGVTRPMADICFDAQTSGGLLICLPQAKAEKLLGKLHKAKIEEAAIIGRIIGKGTGKVFLEKK